MDISNKEQLEQNSGIKFFEIEDIEEYESQVGQSEAFINPYTVILKEARKYQDAGLEPTIMYDQFRNGFYVTSKQRMNNQLN